MNGRKSKINYNQQLIIFLLIFNIIRMLMIVFFIIYSMKFQIELLLIFKY